MSRKFIRLKRKRHVMPEYVLKQLKKHNLLNAYKNRPAYQQNDYIGWIIRAKREQTKEKRLQQMILELKKGNIYMKMKWQKRHQ